MPQKAEAVEPTYSLGAASRLTGLSPEVLRAWERRYGAVRPLRTAGGTRRYRAEDLERLRLVKAAVDAGNRIGKVATLPAEELLELAEPSAPQGASSLEAVLQALDRLDAVEAQRLMALQLSSRGPARFAQEFVAPLVREIGDRWASERLGIASEHLATAVLRALLGAALVPSSASLRGPRIVFATPSGERHELGLQMAALAALSGGANPVYLGAEVPVEDLLAAAERAEVDALALSIATLPPAHAERGIAAIRAGLPDRVRLWVGGAGAAQFEFPEGVEHIASLEDLERRVARLGFELAGGHR
jgi:DNA-binding transcriptional MerR regulator